MQYVILATCQAIHNQNVTKYSIFYNQTTKPNPLAFPQHQNLIKYSILHNKTKCISASTPISFESILNNVSVAT